MRDRFQECSTAFRCKPREERCMLDAEGPALVKCDNRCKRTRVRKQTVDASLCRARDGAVTCSCSGVVQGCAEILETWLGMVKISSTRTLPAALPQKIQRLSLS